MTALLSSTLARLLGLLVLLAQTVMNTAHAYQPPELELPPLHSVKPGHAIAFGLNVVDQDGDTIIVDLVNRPASANYDPLTLTINWTPTPADEPAGRFLVKLTEVPRNGGPARSYLHEFAIAVDPKATDQLAPALLGPVVEQVITIHDPQRLDQVNRDWPIERVFQTVAHLEESKAPGKVGDLMQDALDAMAELHNNPRIKSMKSGWRIVAVRPRLDKSFQELRLVYKNMEVPEPVYLMFRFRLAPDQAGLPPEEKTENNRLFTGLVYDYFFDGPQLRPAHVKDKQEHGKAISKFLTAVLEHPRATFLALPHEGRLGGGSKRTEQGNYASGDGWAWGVIRVQRNPDIHLAGSTILGFTSDIRPREDSAGWQSRCAPKFEQSDLCLQKLGFTNLPGQSKIDATNLFLDHKMHDMVEHVALRDPRRELFEENGMTCSQCHVRNFGLGDQRDAARTDPKAGRLPEAAPYISTTMFNLVPEEDWRPFMVELQRFQECAFKDAIKRYRGVETALNCPLKAE